MTPTTKRFAWHDRDTAARDLLQLAYHAPPTIRARALRLLRHIRSPAILPELEQIVLDENGDICIQKIRSSSDKGENNGDLPDNCS